jgi:hypothetical protein
MCKNIAYVLKISHWGTPRIFVDRLRIISEENVNLGCCKYAAYSQNEIESTIIILSVTTSLCSIKMRFGLC